MLGETMRSIQESFLLCLKQKQFWEGTLKKSPQFCVCQTILTNENLDGWEFSPPPTTPSPLLLNNENKEIGSSLELNFLRIKKNLLCLGRREAGVSRAFGNTIPSLLHFSLPLDPVAPPRPLCPTSAWPLVLTTCRWWWWWQDANRKEQRSLARNLYRWIPEDWPNFPVPYSPLLFIHLPSLRVICRYLGRFAAKGNCNISTESKWIKTMSKAKKYCYISISHNKYNWTLIMYKELWQEIRMNDT